MRCKPITNTMEQLTNSAFTVWLKAAEASQQFYIKSVDLFRCLLFFSVWKHGSLSWLCCYRPGVTVTMTFDLWPLTIASLNPSLCQLWRIALKTGVIMCSLLSNPKEIKYNYIIYVLIWSRRWKMTRSRRNINLYTVCHIWKSGESSAAVWFCFARPSCHWEMSRKIFSEHHLHQ